MPYKEIEKWIECDYLYECKYLGEEIETDKCKDCEDGFIPIYRIYNSAWIDNESKEYQTIVEVDE